MGKAEGVKISQGFMEFWKNRKFFLSTEGSEIEQEIIESGGGISAHAINGDDMQVRSYPNSFRGQFGTRGYELIRELDFLEHAERVAEEASQLLSAPQCPSGEYVLVLDGNQLGLQIHESIGHPTELDRILGMEASFAGTSFIAPDDIGKLQYGSPIMNITADATLPGGLGTFGYDDEGTPAQKIPMVREGILTGLLTSRETAYHLGLPSSNGTARASGWNRIPLIRMTNINIEPGEGTLEDIIRETGEGLFMSTNRSWSIDDKRLNFQFGCEIAWEIKNGKLGRIFKNPNYMGITPEFWATLDWVAGPGDWIIWGTPNCGKGQPGQTAHVGHGASPARFRNVKVGIR
jgi:TldD protein